MCGIAGIYSERKTIGIGTCIKKMTDAMSHRGPDAEGFFEDYPISLGHRRLSIIDTSSFANQPMEDISGRYILVFNGEIYNYRSLKDELKKEYAFQNNSDSEVILAAFIKWKEKCLTYFNGIFAFAIWDRVEKRLFIARDHLGIKPLYYTFNGKEFVFASEIRSILASGLLIKRKISTSRLFDYLMYQSVHEPQTILEDVYTLGSGEYGWVDSNGLKTHKFWSPYQHRPIIDLSYSEITSQVKSLFYKAIERQMVSDVPIGAFLSGGIDSSIIVALMAECSPEAINTFNISYKESDYDESYFAKLIAKKYNTKHHDIRLSANVFLEELPQIFDSIDNPSPDGSNTYIVSKFTKAAGISVALSGLGSDEIFAGYSSFKTYYQLFYSQLFWKIPQSLRVHLSGAAAFLSKTRFQKTKGLFSSPTFSFENIYPFFRQLLNDTEISTLTHLPKGTNFATEFLYQNKKSLTPFPILSQFSIAEIVTYTQPVLLKDSDQMSMAHSLELRVPFFDHELVDYVLAIPDQHKYPHYPKKLLVDCFGQLLPKEIIYRKKKGFSLPWEYWMKNELKSFCEEKINHLTQFSTFNGINLMRFWNGFLRGDKDILWSQIWAFVVISDWITRNNIDCD